MNSAATQSARKGAARVDLPGGGEPIPADAPTSPASSPSSSAASSTRAGERHFVLRNGAFSYVPCSTARPLKSPSRLKLLTCACSASDCTSVLRQNLRSQRSACNAWYR